jgi:integrase
MRKTRGDSGGDRPKWLGGFIRFTKAGRPTYVIERHWRGGYFKASTRCHTEKAALSELARFEEDPESYVAGGRDVLRMTPELIMEYRAHQINKGITYEWANDVARLLGQWLVALDGRDLRKLKATEHIKPALVNWKSQPARVVALKGFFTWLRKDRGLLEHAEDPMPDVRIPKRESSRYTGPRDVPFDRVQRVFRALREDVRDVLQLLVGTGWHLSEAIRFATTGEIRKDPTGKHLAVLVTWHKRKEHAVSGLMKREHLEAAKRIRAGETMLGRSRLAYLMRRACRDAGLPKDEWFGFGDMRHSVSTWAIEAGDTIENTAKAFNHASEAMLRGHYVRHAVPRGTVKTRTLR